MIEKDKSLDGINHAVTIKERKNVLITGVKKVDSFDEKEFLVETVMGHMLVKGVGLEMIKLDTFQGQLSINGLVSNIMYFEDNKKGKNDTLVSKLFK